MKPSIYLEDYSSNKLNKTALSLSSQPPLFIYFSFNDNAIVAYSETLKNMSDLETSTDSLCNGLNCYSAISAWYLSLASFVYTLLKVVCLKSGKDYMQIRALPLDNQYKTLLQILEIDSETQGEKELFDKLQDFEKFYRNLPYDLFENEVVTYKIAKFAKAPTFVNQVDIFQCLLIVIEVFEKLRYVIAGLDLMPNISLATENKKVVFEKLIVLKDKVLNPAFKDILSKFKLKTHLDISKKFTHYPVSRIFEINQVYALFRYQEEDTIK